MKLCLTISDMEIIRSIDADFVEDVDDQKSTSSHVFLVGGTIVSWLNNKHGCVARIYTMEVEYIYYVAQR